MSHSPFLHQRTAQRIVQRYDPDLLVVALDATDIGDDFKYARRLDRSGTGTFDGTHTSKLLGKDPLFIRGSAIVERLYLPLMLFRSAILHPIFVSQELLDSEVSGLVVDGVQQKNRFFHFRHPIELTEPFFSKTMDHVEKTAEHVRNREAQFLLLLLPRFQHWDPSACPDNWESEKYSVPEPYQGEYLRYFEAETTRRGLPVLNLLPAFEAANEGHLVFPDDPHWTPAGHQVVAAALARFLQGPGEGLLPDPLHSGEGVGPLPGGAR